MKVSSIRVAAGFVCLAIAALASPPALAAIESRNILKTYFETGSVPTEEQFEDLIDSYIHQTDDGLTLYAIGATANSIGSTVAVKLGKNVGINETLPDTVLHVWRPVAQPGGDPVAPMCDQFCGSSGFLPLQYLDAVGESHYGFLQIDMGADPGASPGAPIFVTQWVWESSANTTLSTFAVPEPASATAITLLALTALGSSRWRKR
jgi:hypothetical protein